MRKPLLLIILLSAAASAQVMGDKSQLDPAGGGSGHTFSFLHANTQPSCGTTCVITTTSTTSGSLIVIWITYSNTARSISSVTCSPNACNSGGGAYVHCTNCNFTDSANLGVDGGYILAVPSGVTSITVTGSATLSASQAEADEVSYTGTGAISLDNSGGNALTTCESCAVVGLTITGSSDYVSRDFAVDNTPTAPGSPWTNPGNITVNGVMGALNQSNANTFNVAQSPDGGVAQGAMVFK